LRISLWLFIFLLTCSQPREEGSLVVGLPSDVGSIDPLFATDLVSRKLNKVLFRKLFKKEDNGFIKNDLVESTIWKNQEVEIFLKSDTKITTEDVVYSIKRAKKENHPQSFLFSIIKNIYSIDASKIKIEFLKSKEELLDLLSSPAASVYNEKEHKSGRFISDTNYKLEKWDRGNEILLLGQENADFKKVYLKVFQNSTSAIYLFSKEKIDIFRIPFFLANHPITKQANLKTIEGNSVQYIAFNHNGKCFDQEFKQALNYAINRERILEKIFYSLGDLTYLAFPKKYTFPNLKLEKYQYSYNPDLAKTLLEKSKCHTYWKENVIEIRMRADDENRAKGAAIAEDLKAIGLKVKIFGMEKAPLYKENSQGLGDLTLLTWYIDYDSALNFIDPLFASDKFGNGGNRSYYKNNTMDEIIFSGRKKLQLTENAQKETMEILKSDSPWIFLWSLHENYLIRSSINKNKHSELFLF
jgi:peptide/nickel transport system substrate-binding protein